MPVAYIMQKEQDKILPLCASLTPLVEPYKEEGIFLGLDAPAAGKLAASNIYKKGRCALASSKLTSRAACMLRGEKGKLFLLEEGGEAAFLGPLPVDFLWPLGEEVIRQLKILGLFRIEQAASISREELCLQFGEKDGPAIYDYSRGIDTSPVLPLYPPKILEAKRSFEPTVNKEAVEKVLFEVFCDIKQDLLDRGQAFQSLCVEFVQENGHTASIKRSFTRPVCDFDRGLMESIVSKIAVSSPVVQVGVSAGNLKPVQFAQVALWEDPFIIMKKKIDARRLAADMRNRFPHQKICCAGEIQVSRREKALSVWDPFRFGKKA